MRSLENMDKRSWFAACKMSAETSERNNDTTYKGDKVMKYIKPITFVTGLMFFFVLLGLLPKQAQATVACAQINANGTPRAAGSFRVNLNGLETRRLGVGQYEVDFTPVSTDIRNYVRSAVLDTQTTGTLTGQIGVADRAGDLSSVWVDTRNSAGAPQDLPFDLCIS